MCVHMYVHCGNRSPIQSHNHVNVLSNQCTWQLCGCQAYVVLIMKYRHSSKVWDYRSIMLSCTHTITVGRVQSAWVKFHVYWVSAPLARAGKFVYHNIHATYHGAVDVLATWDQYISEFNVTIQFVLQIMLSGDISTFLVTLCRGHVSLSFWCVKSNTQS